MKTHYMNLISAGLTIVALVLHIVCIDMPYYYTADLQELMKKIQDIAGKDIGADTSTKGQMHLGLFKTCIQGKFGAMGEKDEACFTYGDASARMSLATMTDVPDWLQASQALSIIGVLLVAGSTALLLLHVFVTSQGDRKRLLPPFVLALCVAGAIFILIADVVFAVELRALLFDDLPINVREELKKVLDIFNFKLSWGFWLDIVAGIVALFAGLFQGATIFLSRSEESGIV